MTLGARSLDRSGRLICIYIKECLKKRVYEGFLRRYDDGAFVQRLYRRHNPTLMLDLQNPQGFSEKLQWLKLYYRDPRIARCSDKARLKEYLREQGLGEWAVPTLALYDSTRQLDEAALPERFVLKATHGCGWNLICRGDKDTADWRGIKRVLDVWLSESLYMFGREWNYREPTPRLMLEPLLSDEPRPEYKLMCFNGTVRAVQVNHAVDGKACVDLYDREWHFWRGAGIGPLERSKTALPVPSNLEEMIAVAGRLSKPFPFVRVDFIQGSERFYIGELTFFTGAGFLPVTPLEYDRKLGGWLELPPQNHG